MAAAIKAGRKVGPRSGYVKATFSLEPAQLAAVLAEAVKRMGASGAGRPDASAVLREVLDAWLKRRK